MVLIIAACHGLVIFAAAGLFRNKIATALVAVLMAIVAIVAGDPSYAVPDLAGVGLGTWAGWNSFLRRPVPS